MDFRHHVNVNAFLLDCANNTDPFSFVEILCQPLPTIPFGSYDSEECTDQKSTYGTNCTLSCSEGFELKGPSSKACGGTRNGAWSNKNKIPRCVDISPPSIVCPQNYSLELSGNKSYILLSSFNPLTLIEGKNYMKLRKK